MAFSFDKMLRRTVALCLVFCLVFSSAGSVFAESGTEGSAETGKIIPSVNTVTSQPVESAPEGEKLSDEEAEPEEDVPGEGEQAAEETVPAEGNQHAEETAPDEAEQPAAESVPDDTEQGAAEDTSAEAVQPAAEAASTEAEQPDEDEQPAAEAAPAEEVQPDVDAAGTEETLGNEDTIPAEDKITNEDAIPAETEQNADEITPADAEQPAEEAVPAETEPAAEAEPTEDNPEVVNEDGPANEETAAEPAAELTRNEELAPAEAAAADADGEEASGLFVLPDQAEEADPAETKGVAAGARSLDIEVEGYRITACGDIPEDAEIQAVKIPDDAAAKMSGRNTLFAYDIRLVVDGKVWQPEEHGTQVRISVQDLNGELGAGDIKILHVKTDFLNEDGSLSEQALENAVQEVPEGGLETETIATSAKDSAVSFGTGSFSGFVASAMAKIEALFRQAVEAQEALDKKIRIVLEKNTTYEGDVELSTSKEVKDGFEVEFVAEDALDESGAAVNAGGSGKTVVSGDVLIKGISVALRGITMAAGKKINVSDGALTYEGTNSADTLNVEVAKDGAAKINTYDAGDNVTVAMYDGAKSVEVNTGDGDDNLAVNAYSGSLKAETEAGDDEVSLNLQPGAGAANVATGDGNDKVTALLANGSGTTIETGEGADRVEIDAQHGADKITVKTGAGDDRVSAKKTDKMSADTPAATMNIDLGEGADRLDVDMSAARTIAAITAEAASKAISRLHLTGKLDNATAADQRIQWVSDAHEGIKFVADGGKTLTVSGVNNFASLTDTMENKRTGTTSGAGGNYQDFTDYTIDNATAGSNGINWSGSTDNSRALSNLVLPSANDGSVRVGDITATGFSLLIKGKTIDLNGIIKANNIAVAAKDGDYAKEPINPDSDNVMSQVDDVIKYIKDSFTPNIEHEAVINVNSGARLYAVNNIDLTAETEQNGGLLGTSLIEDTAAEFANGKINPLNVKIGTAEINIRNGAEITAGHGADGNADANIGSVTAEARITTESPAGGDNALLPIAISVAVDNAAVNVAKGAQVKAADNIILNSESKTEASAGSTSRLAPFAVGVDVAVNNATTNVKGTLTAGRGVTVSALGELSSDVSATHGEGLSGLFLGVNVALQNVRAQVDDGAAVKAGGAVNVKSTAKENVKNVAKAGTGEKKSDDDSEMQKTKEMGVGMAKQLAGALWDKLGGKVKDLFTNDETAYQKMDKLMKNVAGNEYSVKLAEGSEQKGDVKFTTEQMEEDPTTGRHQGVYTRVQITPWPGHKVKEVYYAYLNNEADKDAAENYTVKKASEGDDEWLVPQENADVLVIVTYTDSNDDDGDRDAWNPDDLFNAKDDDDYGEDLQKLFSDATEGAQNSDADEPADNKEEDTATEALKFIIEKGTVDETTGKTVGAIVNTRFHKVTGECAKTVAKDGKVTFTVNAKAGWQLKEDGLVVSYYIEGEEKEQKTILKDDGNGRYTFTVPEKILTGKYDDGASFSVSSEFEPKDAEANKDTDQTRNQVNGAVAVTVAMNDNRAEILKGADVTAGGKVSVTATEETKTNTNTDGTGVVKNAEKKEEKKKKQEEEQKQYTQENIVPGLNNYSVNISYNVYKLSEEEDPYDVKHRKIGNVYYVKADKDKYYFSVQPDSAKGYTVKNGDVKATFNDATGAVQTVSLTHEGNYWTIEKSRFSTIQQGSAATVNVRFTENNLEIKQDENVEHGKLTFSKDQGKATDVITITAKPDKDYGTGKIKITYLKNTGISETKELTPDEKGEVEFTIPANATGTIQVSAAFNAKTLSLKNRSEEVTIDTSSKVSAGEKIAVTLNDDAAKAGKKLNSTALVTYSPEGGSGRTTVDCAVKDGKVTLPDEIATGTDVEITVNAVEKEIPLNNRTKALDHGTLQVTAARADKGEQVVVTISPDSGFRFKQGSGTVEITTSTSTYKVKLKRNDDKSLTFTLPSSMTSAEITEARTKGLNLVLNGEFEEGNPDSSTFDTSAGAGAAVAIVTGKNGAQISGGSVTGKAVNVSADTVGESKVSASAGYSKAVTGLAGGFGINVTAFNTNALIKKDAVISTDDMEVSASGNHGLETSGSAAGAKDAAVTGVGSGIAVNVSSADVAAGIQDGSTVTATGSVTVTATNKSGDKVTAKAGAKAETGVTPVVALDVFGSSADAYLGKIKNAALTAKTVSVKAANTSTHGMTADASTGGAGVALGGTFAIAVIHDEAKAQLNKSVNNAAADSSITVSVTANTTQSLTATAGAAGGVKGKEGKNGGAGSADKQADSILGGASNIASKSKSSSLSLKGSGSDDRQKAQTSEGSIGGAAAFAVNVLSSAAEAMVRDGVDINIGGAVAVKSVNRTETKVKANGSTAKTDTGVGVAAAVNIVDIVNTAEIGTGNVKAGSLTVSALMPEKAKNDADQMATEKMPESKDKMIEQMDGYIRDGINDTLSELGVDQSIIGELAAEFSQTFVEYVLKETGLDEVLGNGTFEEKKSKILADLEELWKDVKEYPSVLIQPLMQRWDEITGLADLDKDKLKKILLDEVKTQLPSLLKSSVTAVLDKAKDDIGSLALAAVNDKIQGKNMDSVKEKATETLKNAVKAAWSVFADQMMTDALTHLRTEVPVLTQQNIDAIKNLFTTTLDDKKAGFIDYLTGTFQQKVFDYTSVLDKIKTTDFKEKAKEIMRGALKASVTKITDTAISKLVDKLDVKIVPEDLSDKHVVRTEAIAGAAAKDVGIAGAVAVTILNATTTAVVNSGSSMIVSGEADVKAQEARRVNSVASAALDANGNADKNKDGGKKEEKDTAGGSEATPTVHVSEQLEVKTTAGAKLTQDTDDREIVWIEAQEGWKIHDGTDLAVWSYTDETGKEKTGSMRIYTKDGRFYVDASDAVKAADRLTTITVKPMEDLHTISGLDTINYSEDEQSKGQVPDGTVTVTVDGRDDPVKDGKLSAKATDTVKIAVDKTKFKGLRVDGITYFTGSEMHNVPLSATENGDQIVFTFSMPAKDVTGILVEFDKVDDSVAEGSKTAATDDKGRSVGVGASFAMVYGDSAVNAEIRRDMTAGALAVTAESDHKEETVTVSGTDPLTGELDTKATKKTAVDASVALDILDNKVTVSLDGAAKTTKGNLTLNAKEKAISETHASGYAVGSTTAVGAAAAVNIASSEVTVEAMKDLTAAGAVKISANAYSEDVTKAFATAMGADIARNLSKVGEKAENLEEKSNDLLTGKIFDENKDKKTDNEKNKTADKINTRMDNKKSEEGGEKSSRNLSVSSNALRNQNVTTNGEDAGSDGTDEAVSQIGANTDSSISSPGNKDTKKKIQVAAAVGVTVASHEANVQIGKITAGDAITAAASNAGNFNTMGTGAAMSLAEKANSIAFGVAVSVNNNKAKVTVAGDLTSTGSKDINLNSTMTQNMDGDFRGKLAAQALAGSVAGKDSTISMGGAVSVVIAKAESGVDVADGKNITGGSVDIEAADKSKLSARAGGISVSKGSSVGMGIASTTIISSNEVTASVGNGATITADSFRINAEKKAVKDADFKQAIDWSYFISDSSKLTEEQRKEANTGLIDVHKDKDSDNYKVELNLSSEKLLDAVDALNFLSSQNTYAEAIAGSVATGKTKASISGSFAVAVTNNTVKASLGNNVTITTRKGNADVNAADNATTRIIAGSLSAAPAKASVGVTVAALINSDSATAQTGSNVKINSAGDFTHKAEQTGDAQVFTAAMSVAAGADVGTAAGGAINVIVNRSVAENIIESNAVIRAGGKADIGSKAEHDLTLLSGSANVAAGGNAKVAAGGTVNVIVDSAKAGTKVDNSADIIANSDLTVASDVKDHLVSGALSASAAFSGTGKSGAGAVNVIVSKSNADTTIGGNASLTAATGDLAVKANNDAWMLNASLAAAGSMNAAIGGAFNVNVFSREAKVNLTDGILNAGGNLYTRASGRDTTIMAGLAVAGSVSGAALTGNVEVLVESNRIRNEIGKGVIATAGKNAVMESYYSEYTVDAAGSIAASGGSAAVGATVVTVVKNNDVKTLLGRSKVTGLGSGGVQALNGNSVDGIYVGANASETQFLGAAGIAVSGGSAAVNGVVDVLVNNNKVIADASEAELNINEAENWTVNSVKIRYKRSDESGYYYITTINVKNLAKEAEKLRNGTYTYLAYYVGSELIRVDANNPTFDRILKNGGITVEATDDTKQTLLAGGVNASAGAGVGASVVTLVSGKEVKAMAHDMAAYKNISVNADNTDDVTMLAVSAGLSGSVGVQIGAAVQVLKSKVIAEVGSTVSSKAGSVGINAENETKLKNIAAAVAAAGSVAVTPAAVVTYFTGETDAVLKSGSTVNAAQDVSIKAKADKVIDLYSAGASIGGAVGVSGTANVIVSKDQTATKAEKGTVSTSSAGGLNIQAQSDYKLTSATAALAGGTVGAAVNAVVSVIKSSTLAELAGTAKVKKDVNVKAAGSRNITNVGANLGAGMVGAGVNVMVLAAGEKMSQDAADMLVYGNNSSKGSSKTFDAGKLMSNISKGDKGGSKYYGNEVNGSILAADTAGNGHYESKTSVGGTTVSGGKKQGTFDATSGYRSKDFDNTGYNDNGEIQRGEKLEAKDTKDVANAKQLNVYTSTAPEDAVIARITEDAVIENANNLTVTAEQPVTADLYGVTIGAGAVGVGVSAAVAMLHSTVSASSMGRILNADGKVSVTAESRSGGDVTDRSSDLKKLLKDLNPASGGIRAIGATVGAGLVGVSVGAAVVLTDNQTQAILGGTVSKAANVNVDAKHDYGHVTAAVGSISAGAVAVAASVAMAQSEADVTSKIADNANIISSGDVKVTSTGNQNVTAAAATAGGGIVSSNAGVALAVNRIEQHTGIGSGASVNADNITVKAASDTVADSALLGVSMGLSGVALNAAVSQADAKLNTVVNGATLKAKGTVDISNDVVSTSTPKVLSLAGGGFASGGNVLLAFNETESEARVTGSKVEASTLNVVADLQGKAVSDLTTVSAGGIAVGLSVNYADMRADNRAVLSDSTVNVKDLLVRTGRSDHDNTSAVAKTIAGGMGFAALNMNAAIARNNTKNYAVVQGGDITATNSFKARGYDIPKAEASVTGLKAGVLSVAVNAVVALNDADTRAVVKLDKLTTGAANFETVSMANTSVNILTGGGALFKGDANVGAAYGRTASIVDAEIGALNAKSLTAATAATDEVTTKITNGSFGGVKANAMIGTAYSQDTFNTKVKLGDGSRITGDTKVTTAYTVVSDADVTPQKGGLDANLLKLTVNLASARNTAYAGADLTVQNGTAEAKNVTVQTTGSGSTNAIIRPVKIEVSGVKVATNYANSDLSMKQAATLTLKGATLNAGNVNVKALANKASSTASVGTAGASGITISLANKNLSHAFAKENLDSTAGILGENGTQTYDVESVALYRKIWGMETYLGTMTKTEYDALSQEKKDFFNVVKPVTAQKTRTVEGAALNAASLNVISGMKDDKTQSVASATSNGAKNVSFATLGNLESKTTITDSFSAVLQNVNIKATGKATVSAKTNAKSNAYGGAPGSYAAIDGGITHTNAYIGSKSDYLTAQVLIGEGVKLTADSIDILAKNQTSVEAKLENKGGYSLAKLGTSTQYTDTWVNTGLIIGKHAELTASGQMDLKTSSNMSSTSKVESSSTGFVLNIGSMKGHNEMQEDNNLLIDKDVKLKSGGNMNISAYSKAKIVAESKYSGSFSVIGSTAVEALNKSWRNMLVSFSDGVTADSKGSLSVTADLGMDDSIYTHADETSSSALSFAKAYAHAYAKPRLKMSFNAVNLTSKGNMDIRAESGGSYETNGSTDVKGGGVAPTGHSYNELDTSVYVYINQNNLTGPRATFTSTDGRIDVAARMRKWHVKAKNWAEGGGGAGRVDAICDNWADSSNVIWVDNTTFTAKKGTYLASDFAKKWGNDGTFFEELPEASLYTVFGLEKAVAKLRGTLRPKIYTHNRSNVNGGNTFNHIAEGYITHNYYTKCTGAAVKGIRDTDFSYTASKNAYCDFCKKDWTKGNNEVNWDIEGKLKAALAKALAPINDINRQVNGLKTITKARYEEIDDQAAGAVYALDLKAMLLKDVRFGEDGLSKYRLWNNSQTDHDVYLMHNAAQLYRGARMDYISDVLEGTLSDGNTYEIDIFTALNRYAFSHPVIPIGSSGSLDFSTGIFTLPELSDFELYLHEVSGSWMIGQINDGYIRRYKAKQEAVNAFALQGGMLPENTAIVEGLTELNENDGWKYFWMGDTPDTADDPDQWLIVLYLNEETDEIDAGRITRNMLEAGEEPVDVSLYLFRDSKSDRDGEEKYNVLFFDTPKGQKSLVKVVTNVLEGRTLEMPRPIRIVLRGRKIGGADLPVFSLTDHYFAMNDGTDGEIIMFEGFYTATFDGDVFESDYTKVEGIRDGELTVTVKKDQPIWPEWLDEDSAEDLNGADYELVDKVWYNKEDVPVKAGA